MEQTIAVERDIWIAAPRERVWKAITDPEQVGQWFSPGTNWRSTGLHVGARLSVYDPDTDTEMYTQILEVVDPPHRLVTRSDSHPPEKPFVTAWTLEEENGGTRLLLRFSGYESLPDDTRRGRTEQDGTGFGMMLENIKAQVEGTPLPYPGGF
jgi:uncharacterized protein YndB with AHSA1/START domain